MRIAHVLSLITLTLAATATPARADAEAAAAPRAHEYRVQINVDEMEGERRVDGHAFVVAVVERSTASVKVGSNIPLATQVGGGANVTNTMRSDVGSKLSLHVEEQAGAVALFASVEMSSVVDASAATHALAPTLRKLSIETSDVVLLGKATVIATADDPVSHHRYVITATVNRAR